MTMLKEIEAKIWETSGDLARENAFIRRLETMSVAEAEAWACRVHKARLTLAKLCKRLSVTRITGLKWRERRLRDASVSAAHYQQELTELRKRREELRRAESHSAELERLRAENAELRAMLEAHESHGISAAAAYAFGQAFDRMNSHEERKKHSSWPESLYDDPLCSNCKHRKTRSLKHCKKQDVLPVAGWCENWERK